VCHRKEKDDFFIVCVEANVSDTPRNWGSVKTGASFFFVITFTIGDCKRKEKESQGCAEGKRDHNARGKCGRLAADTAPFSHTREKKKAVPQHGEDVLLTTLLWAGYV
jgi:hypothetical protein